MNRLILGTAQFGLDYGINNMGVRMSESEVGGVLDCALHHGLDMLDTAPAYGDSESVIGRFTERTGTRFRIISKLSSLDSPETSVRQSLSSLKAVSLYGLLIHDFSSFAARPDCWSSMMRIKERGFAGKIGFSLYYPSELDWLLEKNIGFDFLQIPFNVLDQRFAKRLPELKKCGVEIHARSVFLQGLFFKNPGTLADGLKPLAPKLRQLIHVAEEAEIPLSALCINFALLDPAIDFVVIGVDGAGHLLDNLRYERWQDATREIHASLKSLEEENEDLVVPTRWAKLQ